MRMLSPGCHCQSRRNGSSDMENIDNKYARRFERRMRDKLNLPPEKLLSILRGMYPEEIAQEIFENLSKEGEKSDTD